MSQGCQGNWPGLLSSRSQCSLLVRCDDCALPAPCDYQYSRSEIESCLFDSQACTIEVLESCCCIGKNICWEARRPSAKVGDIFSVHHCCAFFVAVQLFLGSFQSLLEELTDSHAEHPTPWINCPAIFCLRSRRVWGNDALPNTALRRRRGISLKSLDDGYEYLL